MFLYCFCINLLFINRCQRANCPQVWMRTLDGLCLWTPSGPVCVLYSVYLSTLHNPSNVYKPLASCCSSWKVVVAAGLSIFQHVDVWAATHRIQKDVSCVERKCQLATKAVSVRIWWKIIISMTTRLHWLWKTKERPFEILNDLWPESVSVKDKCFFL